MGGSQNCHAGSDTTKCTSGSAMRSSLRQKRHGQSPILSRATKAIGNDRVPNTMAIR